MENLDTIKYTTESQLRRIIDAASVDEPFYPSMEEEELASTCVIVQLCILIYV